MSGRAAGAVTAIRGGLVEVDASGVAVGDGMRIRTRGGTLDARAIAAAPRCATLAPFGSLDGVAPGDLAVVDPAVLCLPLGTPLLGRAIDARGLPLDGGAPIRGALRRAIPVAPTAAERAAGHGIFWTGVRAIDGPLPLARGARIGLFGAPGAGKSTLLDAIVRGSSADAVVLALIGERGREAEGRLRTLTPRTAVVCATGDRPATERLRAAEVAFAQAAALRARGLHVLLVVDSLARVASAAREIALAAGEPAGRGGVPPSAIAGLARLVEVAGPTRAGSITLVATVLSDGPAAHDPVTEAARAQLDGHVVLSERLARAGRFPAIDLPASASRTAADVAAPSHLRAAMRLRAAVAALDDSREARSLGLDPAAGDPHLARALAAEPPIDAFLRQDAEPSPPLRTLTELCRLADRLE